MHHYSASTKNLKQMRLRVADEVPVESKPSHKGLATDVARKRLLAHVALEVSHQRVLVRKGHRAHGTLEGPLARVRAHVLFKHILARERFGAEGTLEGAFPRVSPNVNHHVPFVLRAVVAEDAVELLVTSVEQVRVPCKKSTELR